MATRLINQKPLDPAKDTHDKVTHLERWKRSWGDTGNVEKVRAFVNGMKNNGIVSASKHFPGYDSETNTLSMKDIFITYEGAALQVTQGELNIAVSGNCYLTSTSGDGLYIDLDTHVTLTGNGVLSVEGQNGVYIGSDYYSYKTQTAKLTVQS